MIDRLHPIYILVTTRCAKQTAAAVSVKQQKLRHDIQPVTGECKPCQKGVVFAGDITIMGACRVEAIQSSKRLTPDDKACIAKAVNEQAEFGTVTQWQISMKCPNCLMRNLCAQGI